MARQDHQVLEHIEVLVEVVGLGDHSQPLAHLAPRAVGIEAEHFEPAGVTAQAAIEHPHGGRLAGAVGTEEAEADAVGHLEVDGVDGSAIAVDLDQALGHDGRRGRAGEVGQCCSLSLAAGARGYPLRAVRWTTYDSSICSDHTRPIGPGVSAAPYDWSGRGILASGLLAVSDAREWHRDEPAIGRVGVLIVGTRGAGGPGEVLVKIRGGSETFMAWSDQPLPRGTTVLVTDSRGERTVDVIEWSNPWDTGPPEPGTGEE